VTRALVVGAGAVGQVYGYHLARGGAQVSFLVKPEHAPELEAGLTLYPLNRAPWRRGTPIAWREYGVVTGAAAVAAERWDEVYLAMSSTALRRGDWFAALARVIGGATLVLLQPGPEDRRFVARHLTDEQIVEGIITLISYRAPLADETRFPRPGVAYWFPPFANSPMSGARRASVLSTLHAGGLPARAIADVGRVAAFPTALMMPLLAVLEQAGWSFSRLRAPDRLALAARAGQEALAVMARHRGQAAPRLLRLVARPLAVRLAMRLASWAMPFDVETYLRVHFTKVGDQTRDFLRTYLALGRSGGQRTDALALLSS
jgi:ketopantoate reductase